MVVSLLDPQRLAWSIKQALSYEIVQQVADVAAEISIACRGRNAEFVAYGFAAAYHYFCNDATEQPSVAEPTVSDWDRVQGKLLAIADEEGYVHRSEITDVLHNARLRVTSNGAQELEETLKWALTKIEFPMVVDSDPAWKGRRWKGCPGCREVWSRDMTHKPDCEYVAALRAINMVIPT